MHMFDRLAAAIEEIAEIDPADLTGGELRAAVIELQRLTARLDAAETRLAAAFDASREWEVDGARSSSAWLAWKLHVPKGVARRRVGLGRSLRSMPATEAT